MRLINKKSATYRLNFLSKVLLVGFFFSAFLFKVANHHQVFAATCNKLNIVYSGKSSYVKNGNNSFTVTVSNKDPFNPVITDGLEYILYYYNKNWYRDFRGEEVTRVYAVGGTLTYVINEADHPNLFIKKTKISVDIPDFGSGVCNVTTYDIIPAKVKYLNVYQKRNGQVCYGGPGGGCLETTATNMIAVESQIVDGNGQPLNNTKVTHVFGTDSRSGTTNSGGVIKTEHLSGNTGSYKIKVIIDGTPIEQISVGVVKDCSNNPLGCETEAKNVAEGGEEEEISPYLICDQIPDTLYDMKEKCKSCVGDSTDSSENKGIWTAIGCIPRDPETIVSVLLRFGLGMGGGVALLMILGSGFMLSISQGDPKQTDTAKQWLGSAIAGLLFIIFSVTILQFIGYNVFQIPGFGG